MVGGQAEGLTDARRDNTGAGRYAEGVALPTPAFPSDHALVSARLRLRPWPHPEPLFDPASHPGPPGGGVAPAAAGAEPALLDWWGLGELPPAALARLTAHCPPPPSPSGGGGAPGAGAVGAVGAVGAAGAAGGGGAGGEWAGGARSVWILFSPRPLSAALCKPWFQAALALVSAAPLLAGLANCRAAARPAAAAVAARAFRFTPRPAPHAFALGPRSHPAGHGGAVLAAETARLLLQGRPAAGAVVERVAVEEGGSLAVMSLQEGGGGPARTRFTPALRRLGSSSTREFRTRITRALVQLDPGLTRARALPGLSAAGVPCGPGGGGRSGVRCCGPAARRRPIAAGARRCCCLACDAAVMPRVVARPCSGGGNLALAQASAGVAKLPGVRAGFIR